MDTANEKKRTHKWHSRRTKLSRECADGIEVYITGVGVKAHTHTYTLNRNFPN